jgi:hypothetical protein
MATSQGYTPLKGSEHHHPANHKTLNPTAGHKTVTVTMILRRKPGGPKMRGLEDFAGRQGAANAASTHAKYASDHGADPKELE